MPNIPVETVDTITDFETLLAFFRDTLDWPIPEDVTLGEIAFPWSSAELDLDETAEARVADCLQLPPFAREALGFSPEVGSQPWGIFFVEFSSERVYRTGLRRVLRGLVERRARDARLPAWELDHLLFICTTADFHRFAFAHFAGAGASWQDAVLSIFSWDRGDTHLRTLCEYNLPALIFPRGGFSSPQAWIAKWQRAFDVAVVTDQFFREYKSVFASVEASLSGIPASEVEARRLYTQRLLNRLMFLRFLERKGWLRYAGRRDYFRALYEAAVGIGSPSGSAESIRSGGGNL